jgi:hypothetical protein
MAENHEQEISPEDLTDAQIAEEIRYLDPERLDIGRNGEDDSVLAFALACYSLPLEY